MISDLYDASGFQRGLDVLRHHKHEPHVIQVIDRAEDDPKLLGDVELYDVETDAVQKVTITERNLKQYRKIYADFLESVKQYCNSYAIGRTLSTSDVPFDDLVLKMMRAAGAVSA